MLEAIGSGLSIIMAMAIGSRPRLVLLNGPLGLGKSTLAKMYNERVPLSLNLDIDLVRDSLGQWRDYRRESARMAWKMAQQMGRVVLAAGNDVVVAHSIRRPERFQELESLAAGAGASFHEILLSAPKDEAVKRFIIRGQESGFELGYRPDGLIGRSGGIAWVESVYDEVVAAAESRPRTLVITPLYGSPEETYREVLSLIKQGIMPAPSGRRSA